MKELSAGSGTKGLKLLFQSISVCFFSLSVCSLSTPIYGVGGLCWDLESWELRVDRGVVIMDHHRAEGRGAERAETELTRRGIRVVRFYTLLGCHSVKSNNSTVCVCVCMCVWMREREREKRKGKRKAIKGRHLVPKTCSSTTDNMPSLSHASSWLFSSSYCTTALSSAASAASLSLSLDEAKTQHRKPCGPS